MGKQVFNFKGMMRDLDPAKASGNYAYEIRNLRITAQEDTTFMTLATEKGYSRLTIGGATMYGNIIGYCVLNNYITVFTLYSENNHTYIYRLDPTNTEDRLDAVLLYHGDLNMENAESMETIGIYENENVQNVYWIDGINQPRVINIMDTYTNVGANVSLFDFNPTMNLKEEVTISKINLSGVFGAGTIQYFFTYFNKKRQQTPVFYQSPIYYITPGSRGASPEESVDNAFDIKIFNIDTNFDFVRVYSVFRSSENGTPVCKKVCDISTDSLRTDSGEVSTINVSTSGTGSNVTLTNKSMNTYSMYVINSQNEICDLNDFYFTANATTLMFKVPSAYRVVMFNSTTSKSDVFKANSSHALMVSKIYSDSTYVIVDAQLSAFKSWTNVTTTFGYSNNSYLEVIDNGMNNEVVDYSEILYAGGTNIIPQTMGHKDNTLFFGNYSTDTAVSQVNKDTIKNASVIQYFVDYNNPVEKGSTGSFYMYKNQLDNNSAHITTFKGGETYTFGIVLQDQYGKWTDVIPIGSLKNTLYPKDVGNYFFPVKANVKFQDAAMAIIQNYKRIKIVRLDSVDRVIGQGVLCPTVYNKKREGNSPYCQSSWFFRDVLSSNRVNHRPLCVHDGNIVDGGNASENVGEIQGAATIDKNYYESTVGDLSDMDMFVDCNTLTLHSPDIEFGSTFNFKYGMRIVGAVPIDFGSTCSKITLSSPTVSESSNYWEYQRLVNNSQSSLGYQLDLRSFVFRDKDLTDNFFYYPIYPWQNQGSLNGSVSTLDYAGLKTKVMSGLRGGTSTLYFNSPLEYGITDFKIYQEDEVPLLLGEDTHNPYFAGPKIYTGAVDTVLSPLGSYPLYRKGDSLAISGSSTQPVRMRYRSSKHGVFSLLCTNNKVEVLPNVGFTVGISPSSNDNLSGLNAMGIRLKISEAVSYTTSNSNYYLKTLSDAQNILEVNDVVMISGGNGSLNGKLYYVTASNHTARTATIRVLDPDFMENTYSGTLKNGTTVEASYLAFFRYMEGSTIYYYKISGAHGYEDPGDPEASIPAEYVEPYVNPSYTLHGTYNTGGSSGSPGINQQSLTVNTNFPYLYLAELYIDTASDTNYENRQWYVSGLSKKISDASAYKADIGDTYYQRYDCLKTYPYSLEDTNQIVEIFSFMCETKTNIDGRYDNLRGLSDNTNVLGANFNRINKAYTQEDNFFNYSYLNSNDFSVGKFPNQIIWTKTKVFGSDIDAWTDIPATSTLCLDGSLGQVRALKRWNNDLICFQDMGIAKIMYNERTALTTEQGVPVEIANSGKVEGSLYISNQVGCSNKHTIQTTQEGLYFIDSNKRELYKWSKGLDPISKTKGFNTYFANPNIDMSKIKVFYDPKLKDLYVRTRRLEDDIWVGESLVYNEQLGEFTSFFDYNSDFMFTYRGDFICIGNVGSGNKILEKMFAGDYLTFESYMWPYYIEFIAAENPLQDKTFYGVEFRADVLDTSKSITDTSQSTVSGNYATINKYPFVSIQAWNEYQKTDSVGFDRMFRKGANMSQKFRIWRCDIPREYDFDNNKETLNRIRSPWVRIKLYGGGSSVNDGDQHLKTVIHDIAVNYV